jgi:hypothetical protein
MLDKLYYMLDCTELCCTLELRCTVLSYTLLYPTELCCTLLSFNASFFLATQHPASYTTPCELHCTLSATLHPTEQSCILLSYAETLLSYTTPY